MTNDSLMDRGCLLAEAKVAKDFRTKKPKKKLRLFVITLLVSLMILFALTYFLYCEFKLKNQEQELRRQLRHLGNDVQNSTRRTLSRQNRALKLGLDQVCAETNCFADLNFNEVDVQHALDSLIGRFILNGHFEWSNTLKEVQMIFRRCHQNLNSTLSQKTLQELYNNLMDLEAHVNRIAYDDVDMRRGFTTIVLDFWKTFGVDTLFRLRVAKTFTNKDKERLALVYLDQKMPPQFDMQLLDLAKQGEQLTGRKPGHSDLVYFTTYSANSDLLTTHYEDSPLKWQFLTVDEANQRWPFFDFAFYFRELDYPRNNYKDGEEFKFVVTSPEFLDVLNARFVEDQKPLAYNFLFYLGFYTVLRDVKLQRCAAEIRQHLPLVVSRLFVDSLDENDLELRIHTNLTVYQVLTLIWTQTDDFVMRNLSTKHIDLLNRLLLPTKFFGVDHGYLENEKQFDHIHRRLKVHEAQSMVEMLAELRKFNRLRSILCLSQPENAKCDSYYGRTSCATARITYLPREHTVILPVGLMLLLQNAYDEHSNLMDHHSRFEKMMSTLRCLMRQSFKQRMTKAALLWDSDGRLYEGQRLQEIMALPQVFKCDPN